MAFDADGMLLWLADAQENVVATARTAIPVAEKAGDETTVDLLVERDGKYYWFWGKNAGAKTEEANPTTYQVKVWCNGLSNRIDPPGREGWWSIGVKAEIFYSEYKE